MKLSANGTFLGAVNFGSSYATSTENNVNDLCILGNDDIMLTGHFVGNADFDGGLGVTTLTCGTNNTNAFVMHLYASDLELQSAFAIGGNGTGNNDYSNSITRDANDDIIITGSTKNFSPSYIDFDPLTSAGNIATYGGIFVAKYSNSGIYQWAQIYGGSGTLAKEGKAIFANQTTNDILVMGDCSGNPDFDFTASTYTVPSSNFVSVFYLKLNTNGGLITAKTISGNSNVELSSASVSNDFNNIMTVVRSSGNNCDTDPDPTNTSTISLPILGGGAIFTQKLNSNLNSTWAKILPGSGNAKCFTNNNGNYIFSKSVVRRYNNFGNIMWSYNLDPNTTGNGVGATSIIQSGTSNLLLSGNFDFNQINFNPMATNPTATENGTSQAKTFYAKWYETGNQGFYLLPATITPSVVCLNELATINVTAIGNGTLSIIGLPDLITGLPREITNGIAFPVNDGVNTYSNSAGYYPINISFTNGTNTITLPTQYIAVHPTITPIATPTLQLANPQVGQYDNKIVLPYRNNGFYSWLSCPSYTMLSNQPDINSTQQYTLSQSGSYAAYFQNSNTGCKSDTSICVSYNAQSTDLVNLDQEVKFNIYPNPAKSIVNIELENIPVKHQTISVINSLGETILVQKIESKKQIINIKNIPDGIYFIGFDHNLKKIIKE